MDGDGIDRISGLGPPIWNIFSRFDLPEVTELKLVSPTFRNIIESDPFARYYDRREFDSPSWTVLHLFPDHFSVCGSVTFIRDSDGRDIRFELQPLLHSRAVFPAGRISFVCVKGSLLLFKIPLPCNIGGFDFVALNPFSRQVFRIRVPYDITLYRREHFMLMPDSAHDFQFVLRYGAVDSQTNTPFVREYTSFTDQWGPNRYAAVGDNQLPLESDDERNMVIYRQEWVYFMAFIPGFWQPEFQLNAMEDLFDFQSVYMDVAATQLAGLNPSISFHFVRGGSGYAMVILKGIVPGGDRNTFYVKNVFLYRLNRSGTDIELVSTIPRHYLPTDPFVCAPVYYRELTNGVIKFAIPVMTDHSRSFLLFSFNIADGLWASNICDVLGSYHFPMPDFTSRLTIRL